MATSDVIDVGDNVAPVLATDEDGRLYYEGSRVAFTRFDRSYISAAAAAFSARKDIALVYPSPPTHVQIPILLAVGYQSRTSGHAPVLFVSNRPGIREQYFNLGIGPFVSRAGIEPEPLSSVTTPMVKTGDGTKITHISGHKPRNWSDDQPGRAAIIHTTFGKKITQTLPEELPLSGFVLDFTNGMLDDPSDAEKYRYLADERGVPRTLIFDTPNHSYLEVLAEQAHESQDEEGESNVVFWGWAPDELETAPEDLFEPVCEALPSVGTATDGGSIPSPFTDSLASLRNLSSGISRSVVRIPYSDLEQVSKDAYRRIGVVSNFPDDETYSAAARGAISEAYFVYMYIDTLLTSVEYHDSLAAMEDSASWGAIESLRSKLSRLRDRQAVLEQDVTGAGALFEEACDSLEAVVDILKADNPKADVLAEQIRRCHGDGDSVTVLTSTRKQESILRSFLAEKTEFSRDNEFGSTIQVHSIYSPHTVPSADILLFPGVPTGSHYPAVGSGAAPVQRYLCYDWEVERLEYKLSYAISRAALFGGAGIKRFLTEHLDVRSSLDRYISSEAARLPDVSSKSGFVGHGPRNGDSTILDPEEGERTEARSTPRQQRIGTSDAVSIDDQELEIGSIAPSSVGDFEDLYESELEHDDSEKRETIDAGRSDVEDFNGSTGAVDTIQIKFVDGTYLYEKPSGLVWVIEGNRGSNVKRVRRAAGSLEVGEQLLLIENDSRRDVFEHIVEKIHSECRGEFSSSLTMLDLWTSGIDRVVSQFQEEKQAEQDGDFDSINLREVARTISADLREFDLTNEVSGVSREPASVYQWLIKSTLGPSSPEVIRALGEIYGVEVLRSQYNRIFAGLQDVRHLHQNVGAKLGDIVFSAHGSSGDEWLLEECGLRVDDVQDVAVVKLIEDVGDERRQVDSRRVGKLMHEPLR